MDLNSTEHYYPVLKRGQTPSDYVREILLRMGVPLNDSFCLISCRKEGCCNPAHFQIKPTTAKRGKSRSKLIALEEIAEEIDWDEFSDLGFERYLEVFNSRQPEDWMKITKYDLVNVYVYWCIKSPKRDKVLNIMLSNILDNNHIMKTIAMELFGVTEL